MGVLINNEGTKAVRDNVNSISLILNENYNLIKGACYGKVNG
jgi:hypothetical protein